MTKSIFRDAQATAVLGSWFERFRAKLPVPTESRIVPTRFGDTHVLVGGPAGAPPLVMLHGALASSAHLLGELAPLLERFRIYAVDVIGQSVKSADARLSVTNDDYGRWLEDVLDALALPRADVLGVSWGGFVAIRFAAVAPERITRLVLLTPAGMVNGPAWAGLTKVMLPMQLYRLFPSERRLAACLRHLLTTHGDDWTPYLGDAFRMYRMNMRIPALAKPAELARLTAPVFVLGADQDLSFPGSALLARARQLFPNLAGAEILEGSRHCPPTTDEFRRMLSARVAAFLAEAPPAASGQAAAG
jgi:2-hydroxy-6-oxonona-2,4-dienedioate hydrolase